MKRTDTHGLTALGLIIPIIVLLVGCSESIMLPEEIPSVLGRASAEAEIPEDGIILDGPIPLLRTGSHDTADWLEIAGTIRYGITPAASPGCGAIDLTIVVRAGIGRPDGDATGRVDAKSRDFIFEPGIFTTALEKVYPIQGMEAPTDLHVRFAVDPEGITLSSIWAAECPANPSCPTPRAFAR